MIRDSFVSWYKMNIKTVYGQSCVEHSLPSSAVFAAGNNHIDFTPIEDTEPTCGNTQRHTTMNITNTFTWTWEQTIKVGGDIKFFTGLPGIGAKSRTILKSTFKGGQDTTITNTTQVAEMSHEGYTRPTVTGPRAKSLTDFLYLKEVFGQRSLEKNQGPLILKTGIR
ncbi:hypothetical protein VCV18_010725 [Metarhizium anisopliae]